MRESRCLRPSHRRRARETASAGQPNGLRRQVGTKTSASTSRLSGRTSFPMSREFSLSPPALSCACSALRAPISFLRRTFVKLFTKLGGHVPHVLTRVVAAGLRRHERRAHARAFPPHHASAAHGREADAI